MAKFKIQKSATVNQYFDATNVIGGTGGLTSISGTQIRPNVYVSGASAATFGSILRSKGRSKFLVTDGTNTGVCTLVNVPNAALTSTQMSIGVDTAVISTANVNVYVGGSTVYAYVRYATSAVTGVKVPAAGDYIRGTSLTGNVVVTSVSTSNGVANANVSISSQVVANTAAATNLFVGGYAARLTNKFVTDFSGNKYQWTFSSPTATTVRIPGA